MFKIMVIGAGKIGSLIACLLTDSKSYEVHLADVAFNGVDVSRLLKALPDIKTVALDVKDEVSIQSYFEKHGIQAVISCLPYFLNPHVATAALHANVHYFDLTEDTTVTKSVKRLAENAKTAFVPQCGLAPGFISIAANSLMQWFDECREAKLRVGALPQHVNNALNYALTWSTDGLINGYGNPCYTIEEGSIATTSPLEALETIEFDGATYEAFNTSGGLGSLAEFYQGRVNTLNYKTIRYPGHCEKMRFLMNDLHLNQDRPTLKRILEHALPKTYQDLVIIYISVSGIKDGEFIEKNYHLKIYPQMIGGLEWSAIQISTAASACAVVDLVLEDESRYHGVLLQETFDLNAFLANRFGQLYAERSS